MSRSRWVAAVWVLVVGGCELPFDIEERTIPGPRYAGRVLDADDNPVRALVSLRFSPDCCGSEHEWTDRRGAFEIRSFHLDGGSPDSATAYLHAAIPQGPDLPVLQDSIRVSFTPGDSKRRYTDLVIRMSVKCPPSSYCAAR